MAWRRKDHKKILLWTRPNPVRTLTSTRLKKAQEIKLVPQEMFNLKVQNCPRNILTISHRILEIQIFQEEKTETRKNISTVNGFIRQIVSKKFCLLPWFSWFSRTTIFITLPSWRIIWKPTSRKILAALIQKWKSELMSGEN